MDILEILLCVQVRIVPPCIGEKERGSTTKGQVRVIRETGPRPYHVHILHKDAAQYWQPQNFSRERSSQRNPETPYQAPR